MTSARMQESMLGMYAMRSFIYPRILTVVGYIALLLGYNSSLFVVRINTVIVLVYTSNQKGAMKIAEIGEKIITCNTNFFNIMYIYIYFSIV